MSSQFQSLTLSVLALTVFQSLQLQDIVKEIDEREEIQGIVRRIKEGEVVKKGYTLVEGRLMYKTRLVISAKSKYIPLLLTEYHNRLSGGHSRVLKTYKCINAYFYWKGMKKIIQEYVSRCRICQTCKYSTLSPAGLLQYLLTSLKIWDDMAMDFIEGLPVSDGMNAILVVVDWLSKYGHFAALRHMFIAVDIANRFIKVIVRLHGFSQSIVSDRDRTFQSLFWKELFKHSGTILKFSTAYHPKTDGHT